MGFYLISTRITTRDPGRRVQEITGLHLKCFFSNFEQYERVCAGGYYFINCTQIFGGEISNLETEIYSHQWHPATLDKTTFFKVTDLFWCGSPLVLPLATWQ